MFDILIKNGSLIDGTGKDRVKADIGIVGDSIAQIGDLREMPAVQTIDAAGKCVAPGFIDPHSHNDLNLLIWPENEANIMQGVTTAISGNCGFSPAPMQKVYSFSAWEYRLAYETRPNIYSEIEFFYDLDQIKANYKRLYNYDLDYSTFGEFLHKAETSGFSVNYYPFVGHNNLRNSVMGYDCMRKATDDELEAMKKMLRESMESGARGLSSGLDYPPGCCALTEELIELAKVAAEYGGSYITHFRNSQFFINGTITTNVLAAIKEAVLIGKEAGVRVHLAHVKPDYALLMGNDEDEKVLAAKKVKAAIDEANASGVYVTYDVIPSGAGGGRIVPTFAAMLRPWLLIAGSVKQFLKNLSVPEYAEMVKQEMRAGKWVLASKSFSSQAETMQRILKHKNTAYVGKNVKEIMELNGWTDFEQALIDIFVGDPYALMKTEETLDAAWLAEMLDHPKAIPSSDGFSYNHDSDIGLDSPLESLPHPNNFCYAIRYILHYGKPRLEDTIRQITGIPAEIFNIPDRGVLACGKKADIVVFDPDALATNENYIDSRQFPDGIECVMVNGKITGQQKHHTGVKAGRVLRK